MADQIPDSKNLHDHQNAVISFPTRLLHNDNLICLVLNGGLYWVNQAGMEERARRV
jgi:hypothetical protein